MTEAFAKHDSLPAGTGVDSVCLKIADITIGLTSSDSELKLRVEGPMEKFLADEARPDVIIRVAWDELSDADLGTRLFDSGGIWQLFALEGHFVFRVAGPFSNWLPYKFAQFNSDFTSGDVFCQRKYFPPERPVYPLEYPLDELLVTDLLATGRGVEVHSCGLIDEAGDGYLFVGHSQAGKTTTARLWEKHPGVRILSDDRIIIREREDGLWIYGTPWHGEAHLSSAACAPLKHVFFLRQWRHVAVVPLGAAEAVARFFACSFPPFHSASGVEFTLSFFEELVKAVPVLELRFVPDQSAVELIQQTRF